MADTQYGLLVDYVYCDGCGNSNLSVQVELGLEGADEMILPEVEIGPFVQDGEIDHNYLPFPTGKFSKIWGAGGDKAGQAPQIVADSQSANFEYGPIDEMCKKLQEADHPMALFLL